MFGNAMRVELKSCPWGAGSVAQVGVGLWVCGGLPPFFIPCGGSEWDGDAPRRRWGAVGRCEVHTE